MKLANITIAVLTAVSTTAAWSAAPPATMTTQAEYQATVKNAETAYKSAKAACDNLKANAKDVCIEEAKGRETVAKAQAEAAYKGTPKAQEEARVAQAEATYRVAKEKCDDLAANAKDVCVKEAHAAFVKAKADAKVARVTGDARRAAAETSAAVRRDAAEAKRDADYEVAIEKCDALAGTAKESCVRDVKARLGRS